MRYVRNKRTIQQFPFLYTRKQGKAIFLSTWVPTEMFFDHLFLPMFVRYSTRSGECLPGYRADASRCYKMMRYGSNESRSWSRSRVACRKFGGDLASLETSGEILIADQLRKVRGIIIISKHYTRTFIQGLHSRLKHE